jgi:hypothetical protein
MISWECVVSVWDWVGRVFTITRRRKRSMQRRDSFSEHPRGTCGHLGGVAEWL